MDRLGTRAAIADTIQDTIELNLRLLGEYEIIQLDDGSASDTAEPGQLAQTMDVDAVVFGSVSRADDNRLRFELSFYDREADAARIAAEATADSIFDVFEVGDRIAVEFLQEISGTQIAYGSLTLENEGVQRSYRVVLDGAELGRDLREIPRLVAGDYQLTIETDGIAGPLTLVSEAVEVRPGQTTNVGFAAPGLIGGPAALGAIDRAILTDWAARPEAAGALFVRVIDGLAELAGAAQLERRYRSWQSVFERSTAADRMLGEQRGGADPLFLLQQSLPDIDLAAMRPTLLHHGIGLGNVLPAEVVVDGSRDEWNAARPFRVDARDDIPPGMEYDLRAMYVVYDVDAAYVMVEGYDSLAEFVDSAWFQLELVAQQPRDSDRAEVNHRFNILRSTDERVTVEHNSGFYREQQPQVIRDVDAAWGDVLELRIPLERLGLPQRVRVSELAIYGTPPDGATTGVLGHGLRAVHNNVDSFSTTR